MIAVGTDRGNLGCFFKLWITRKLNSLVEGNGIFSKFSWIEGRNFAKTFIFTAGQSWNEFEAARNYWPICYDIPPERFGECWAFFGHSNGRRIVKNDTRAGILWETWRQRFKEQKGA